ncbi:histidine kinase [Cephaloticoccus primus]|uniref:histidine kinase n=1 Tax=Cephaloticoccus primus TaxID=1548207 RepID=A0A139SRM1_9BACT|nr:ATP-binding protein [Cephaloticoccus primus]KXU37182.1 histidine kinase [Cephaloticoccus primus]
MKAWWGALSLRARLALAFAAMAAGALIFLLAIVARTLGTAALAEGKILPAAAFALGVFFLGGWFVAEWCLRELGKLAAKARSQTMLPDLRALTLGDSPAAPIPAELEGLAALLRQEAARHDRLLGELQRFTADAAHELRTPLTALRTTGEVALSGHADAATLREAIGTMLEEAVAMSALLERLLRLARLEAKAVEPRTLALAEHLAAWREQVLVLAEEKQVEVELDCPRGTGELSVFTDAALLGHAVTNLLHNAIQHSPPGSRIKIAVRHSHPNEAQAGGTSIAISDQGPGIRPEDQARVFERFYRVDKSRTRASGPSSGGHGLGLCIAKTAVERLGGTLTLRSAVGRGATFTLTLPEV